MKVGYARVSTKHQNLESQLDALKKAGCGKFFQEKKSGTSTSDRIELENALKFVREGDTLVVTRLDRFARSMKDLSTMINDLKSKGVEFMCTEQNLDTSTSEGRLMLNMLGAFSEFETDLRAERQADGFANAKARGVQLGGKRKLSDTDKKDILNKNNSGISQKDLADEYDVNRQTIYRALKELK